MRQFFDLFTNTALFVDLTISSLALSFMCALIYAMRWLPGKAADYRDPATNGETLQFDATTSKENPSGRSNSVLPRRVVTERKEAATIE